MRLGRAWCFACVRFLKPFATFGVDSADAALDILDLLYGVRDPWRDLHSASVSEVHVASRIKGLDVRAQIFDDG